MVSDEKDVAFAEAERELLSFFAEKGIKDLTITLSDLPPQANPISGKFKHICRAD